MENKPFNTKDRFLSELVKLKRFSHKVEFGVCVLKEYWGYGIGKNLLKNLFIGLTQME